MILEHLANRFLADVKEWGNRANVVMDGIEKRNEVTIQDDEVAVQNEEDPADERTPKDYEGDVKVEEE